MRSAHTGQLPQDRTHFGADQIVFLPLLQRGFWCLCGRSLRVKQCFLRAQIGWEFCLQNSEQTKQKKKKIKEKLQLLIRLRLCNAFLYGFPMEERLSRPKEEPPCSHAPSQPCTMPAVPQAMGEAKSIFSLRLLHHKYPWTRFTAAMLGCVQSETVCMSRISPKATKAPLLL